MACNMGLVSGPRTLPRLGSWVRIPSPAPNTAEITAFYCDTLLS